MEISDKKMIFEIQGKNQKIRGKYHQSVHVAENQNVDFRCLSVTKV